MFRKFLYSNVLLPLFKTAVQKRAQKSDKIRDTLQGHQQAAQRIQQQLHEKRQSNKPLVWFHVASAGEFLLALPVIQLLKEQGVQCGVTVTSVSGFRWINKSEFNSLELVFHDYYPFDTAQNAAKLLEMIKPDAIVYVKYDLWPNLIWTADHKQIPQMLMCASLHPNSGRYKSAVTRWFYRDLLNRLERIFTITPDDAMRFQQIAHTNSNIATLGNTNYEAVLLRRKNLQIPVLPENFSNQLCLVVGSGWESDQSVILPGIIELLKAHPQLNLIWAPHEINETILINLEQIFADFTGCRLSSLKENARVCLVDSVGQLAGLYDYADVAYVGGGFNKSGVHNVVEPAARGIPTVFGKNIEVSQDAQVLVEQGLGFSVDSSEAANHILGKLLEDTDYRTQLQHRIQQFVATQSGIASNITQHLVKLMKDNLR